MSRWSKYYTYFCVVLFLLFSLGKTSYGQIGGRTSFGFTALAFEPHVSSLGGIVLGETNSSMTAMDFPSALTFAQKEINVGYTSLYGASSAFAFLYNSSTGTCNSPVITSVAPSPTISPSLNS